MSSITVKNESGQVVSLDTSGPKGATVAGILESRIARGELSKATASTKSATRRAGRTVVIDSDTGVRDEKGDLLRSVHGGGIDPDADGDALGHPSGSKKVDGAVEVDGAVNDATVTATEAPPASDAAKAAAKARKA